MKKRIYANHAATTPLMPEALEAMLPRLRANDTRRATFNVIGESPITKF